MSSDTHPSASAMTKAAHRLHHRDGEIEVDEYTSYLPTNRVSRGGEPGAYVMAWIWVSDEDVTDDDKKS